RARHRVDPRRAGGRAHHAAPVPELSVRYVLATANPDKAREIVAILTGVDLELRPTDIPDVDETGEALLDNARLKAEGIVTATGKPAIADDTGLEVAALDGAPGVHTARFAGPNARYSENVSKLLAELDGVADRRARFMTVAVALFPDGREVTSVGVVDG